MTFCKRAPTNSMPVNISYLKIKRDGSVDIVVPISQHCIGVEYILGDDDILKSITKNRQAQLHFHWLVQVIMRP